MSHRYKPTLQLYSIPPAHCHSHLVPPNLGHPRLGPHALPQKPLRPSLIFSARPLSCLSFSLCPSLPTSLSVMLSLSQERLRHPHLNLQHRTIYIPHRHPHPIMSLYSKPYTRASDHRKAPRQLTPLCPELYEVRHSYPTPRLPQNIPSRPPTYQMKCPSLTVPSPSSRPAYPTLAMASLLIFTTVSLVSMDPSSHTPTHSCLPSPG